MTEPAPPSLDHLTITASDFARSLAFYDAALGALGLVRITELVDEEEDDPELEAAAWGAPGSGPDAAAVVWLVTGAQPTTGLHARFRARSRGDVETFFAASLQNGGTEHAAPRRWTVYRRGEFNAIVRDPGGNLIEAVSAE